MQKKEKIFDNQITFYESPDGRVNIEVLYAEENIWLTQKRMAELFDTTTQNITQHLKHIYTEKEIEQEGTCKDFLQVQNEGGRDIERITKMYSLEAIIAVGYRVSSERGTQFRQWATGILKKIAKHFPRRLRRGKCFAILTNAGNISHEVAAALAEREYEKYRAIQDKNYISDFDREVKKLRKKAS